MKAHYLIRAALLGSMLLALSSPQAADVTQCVDEDGAVTYTNLPCEHGANPEHSRAASHPADNWEAREGRAVTYRVVQRKTPLDADTIAAAKDSMLALDKTSPLMRRQNVVALDLRNPGWFDFR